MKYGELVATILDKLNVTEEDAKADRLLAKIPRFCNEALGDIANRGKPYYATLIIDIIIGTVAPATLTENETVSATRFITFPTTFLSLTNEFIQRAPISLQDDGSLLETDTYELIDGKEFRRLSSRQLLFPNEFGYRYLVPTTCRYPTISGSEAEAEINIEPSIVELLPNYVCAEILRNDDVTLAGVYRNLYESSLAALNDAVLDVPGNLSNGGF